MLIALISASMVGQEIPPSVRVVPKSRILVTTPKTIDASMLEVTNARDRLVAAQHALDERLVEGLLDYPSYVDSMSEILEAHRRLSQALNQSSDMARLNLQEATQQRQQALQLASNLLARLHESQKAIIRNIK